MNHATWSLGTVASPNWRHGGHQHHQASRPPRPGSISPNKDRRIHHTKKTHDDHTHEIHTRPRSHEGSPGLCSPVGDNHDKCHSYHYLGVNVPRSNPLTPPAPRRQRKKRSVRRDELMAEDKALSKSPSAPNLHATATSILALQGSLTAFTAMAAGKMQPGTHKYGPKDHTSVAQEHHTVSVTSSPEDECTHRNEMRQRIPPKKVDVQLQSQPMCTCQRSTMSPIPRVAMHAHVPERNSSGSASNSQAWQERRPNPEESAKQSLIQTNAHSKHFVFKETSV